MKILSFSVITCFAFFGCLKTPSKQPVDYVDPFIGSVHGRWFLFTPAALPFGMAKLAPHTNAYGQAGGWTPCGYDFRHTSVEGFGHFHEFQIGGLAVMPTVGALQTLPGSLTSPDSGYRSRIDKESERAEAGYYKVYLKDYGIHAELTATKRVGVERYTFPKSESSRLLFDVGHRLGESGEIIDASVEWTGEEVVGSIITHPFYVKFNDSGYYVKMYFAARIDKQPKNFGVFQNSQIIPQQRNISGKGIGLYLTFDTKEKESIEMQVGLSYTSIENARYNLKEEASGKSFDEIRSAARREWNSLLSRIEIEDRSEINKTKFYTALYRALQGRGVASDANGAYPKKDGTIGNVPLDKKGNPTHNQYNTDAFWGSFWNLFQLWALVYPDYFRDFLQSPLDYYNETGWLPDGMAAGAYVPGVPSNFTGVALASAYQCGIRDFDIETAFQAAKKNELVYENRPYGVGKYDLNYFIERGYIPLKDYANGVGWIFNFGSSHTLEYAYSCGAIAQWAKTLGKKKDYQILYEYSMNYKNLFDSETRFIRPREEDGTFLKEFNIMEAWVGFQEGNPQQYFWYVPHDIKGLINLTGRKEFLKRLTTTFEESRKSIFGGGKMINSFSGLEKLYNHGNQPCLHQSWLFNYAGAPWLTQKFTRLICDEFYGHSPMHGYGYGQDEDQGQLGAWFVLGALGVFNVSGNTEENPQLELGSPLFQKATVHLHPKYYKGKRFVIETKGNGKERYYIQEATLNGVPLASWSFDRKKAIEGGYLILNMGPQPNKELFRSAER